MTSSVVEVISLVINKVDRIGLVNHGVCECLFLILLQTKLTELMKHYTRNMSQIVLVR